MISATGEQRDGVRLVKEVLLNVADECLTLVAVENGSTVAPIIQGMLKSALGIDIAPKVIENAQWMSEVYRATPRLICDDHMIVREGLKRLLETVDDLEVVGEAASGEEVLAHFEQANPDVVLMDVRLPGMSGVETTAALRGRFPTARVLALSTFLDDELIFGALRAGACGYLEKDVHPEDLFAAIRGAARDEAVISGEAASRIINKARAPHRPLTIRTRPG